MVSEAAYTVIVLLFLGGDTDLEIHSISSVDRKLVGWGGVAWNDVGAISVNRRSRWHLSYRAEAVRWRRAMSSH